MLNLYNVDALQKLNVKLIQHKSSETTTMCGSAVWDTERTIILRWYNNVLLVGSNQITATTAALVFHLCYLTGLQWPLSDIRDV